MDCFCSSTSLRILAILHLHAATNPETALTLSEILKYIPEARENELENTLNELIKLGYILEVNKRYYITHIGSLRLMSIYS
ncbi:MAG: hypothetical protein QXY40_08280 [Candidatus Methanomethylicia archaeon]